MNALSTKDFAALVGLTPATVRQMCADKRITRCFQLAGSRRWRIYPDAVREIQERQTDPHGYQPRELVG